MKKNGLLSNQTKLKFQFEILSVWQGGAKSQALLITKPEAVVTSFCQIRRDPSSLVLSEQIKMKSKNRKQKDYQERDYTDVLSMHLSNFHRIGDKANCQQIHRSLGDRDQAGGQARSLSANQKSRCSLDADLEFGNKRMWLD